ncbi:MAG: hypothetical protein WB540_01045 [Pseudolabrys sp.]|jgi:hypothetical protein
MIEPMMYMGIGFLCAVLIAVAVMPLIHDRAVRLTTRRLRATLPQSMKEIQAGRDLLRAEFAMSTRRLEINLEQLKNKSTGQVVELGRRDDVINRLKIQRDALKVDVITLKAQLEALKKRPVASSKGVTAEASAVGIR